VEERSFTLKTAAIYSSETPINFNHINRVTFQTTAIFVLIVTSGYKGTEVSEYKIEWDFLNWLHAVGSRQDLATGKKKLKPLGFHKI
jgi:hypothetical protein